jgi:hypothetical protein
MQQLLQLLHEEIGLPEHKTIRLQTSLNFDLGCDGGEAKQFMEMLEQEFAPRPGDYDTYRYFNPPLFDVFLKRRAKGHGEKIPRPSACSTWRSKRTAGTPRAWKT